MASGASVEEPGQHLRLLGHLGGHQQASLLGHDTTDWRAPSAARIRASASGV